MNTRVPRSVVVGYAQKCKDVVLSPSGGKQLKLLWCKLSNKSGGVATTALLKKVNSSTVAIGLLSSGAYSDVTSTLSAGKSIFSTTNDDGFAVSSSDRIGLIGLTVSQAETGSPVYAYKYWNGTTWATLTTIDVSASYTAADHVIFFPPPNDWVVGGDTYTGLPQDKYNIVAIATTAPSQAVKATVMWCGQILDVDYALANNGELEWRPPFVDAPLVLDSQEGVLPYFGTANALNLVQVVHIVQD